MSPPIPSPSSADPPKRRPPSFTCDDCGQSFSRRTALAHHRVTRHGDDVGFGVVYNAVYYAERPFKCDDCALAYRARYGLMRHVKLEHRKATPALNAPKFDAKYYASRPFKCERCPRAYKIEYTRREHFIMKHQGGEETAQAKTSHDCLKCGSSFRERYQLNQHCRLTHKSTPPPVVFNAAYYAVRTHRCPHCNVACRRYHMLRSHCVNLHHVDITARRTDIVFDADYYAARPFRCSECKEARRGPKQLKWHVQAEHRLASTTQMRTRTKHCTTCAKTFNAPVDLARHMKLAHRNAVSATPAPIVRRTPSTPKPVLQWRCADYYDNCDRSFAARDSLYAHHRRVHADAVEFNAVYHAARAYACDHCPVAYDRSGILQSHMRKVHNDFAVVVARVVYDEEYYAVRPHRCRHCPMAFAKRHVAAAHERRTHGDELGSSEDRSELETKTDEFMEVKEKPVV